MPAVMAWKALHVGRRTPPPPLENFLNLVRTHVAPVEEDRILVPELARLTGAITARIVAPDALIDSAPAGGTKRRCASLARRPRALFWRRGARPASAAATFCAMRR